MTKLPDVLASAGMTAAQFIDAVLGERLDLGKFLRRHGLTRADLEAWMRDYMRTSRAAGEAAAGRARSAEVVLYWWRLLIQQDAAWSLRTEREVLEYLAAVGAATRAQDGSWWVANPADERSGH